MFISKLQTIPEDSLFLHEEEPLYADTDALLKANSPCYLNTLVKLSSYPAGYAYKKENRDRLFRETLAHLFTEKPHYSPYLSSNQDTLQPWLSAHAESIQNYFEVLDLIRSSLPPSSSSKRQLETLVKLAKTSFIDQPFNEEDTFFYQTYYCRLLDNIKAIPDIYEEICFNVWEATGEEAKPFIAANPLSPEVKAAIILASKGTRWFPPATSTLRPIPSQILSTLFGSTPAQCFAIFTQLFHYPQTTTAEYKLAFSRLSEEEQAAIREKAPMVDEWPACWEIKRAVQLINAERKKELMS